MSVRYRGISSSDRPSEDEETKKAQAEKVRMNNKILFHCNFLWQFIYLLS